MSAAIVGAAPGQRHCRVVAGVALVSAVDLLLHLRAAGLRLDVEDGVLLVGPAAKLTDETRDVIRASKAELVLAVLDRADDPRVTCIE